MSDGLRTGTPTSRGEFLLHQERAREKLQQFQLVSPHHYVLEFLKAAWLLNATRVEFNLDSTNSQVRFDGSL